MALEMIRLTILVVILGALIKRKLKGSGYGEASLASDYIRSPRSLILRTYRSFRHGFIAVRSFTVSF